MLGVMALRLSHPNAAKRRVSELLGMELRLESRALNEAIEATAQFFKTQRVVVCCGDRLTLTCLCLAEPIRRAVVGAATTEDEGFELVLRHKPSLLLCSSDLETGYGMKLLRRVKADLPTCQLLIVLVRNPGCGAGGDGGLRRCGDLQIKPRHLGGNGEDPCGQRQRQVGCRGSHPIGGDGVALRPDRSPRLSLIGWK